MIDLDPFSRGAMRAFVKRKILRATLAIQSLARVRKREGRETQGAIAPIVGESSSRDEATKHVLAGMERLKKTSDLSCLKKDRPGDQSR